MHFFTGSHDQYHKPSDTTEKINGPGALEVLEMVRNVADKVAFAQPPRYLAPDKPQALFIGQDAGPQAAYLGIRPDFATEVTGVRVASVIPESPAERILMPGDQLLYFDGEPIVNYYVLTYWLRQAKPGRTATIVLRRNGALREEKVLLRKRS
jgi:S1-C subfamily serine protease